MGSENAVGGQGNSYLAPFLFRRDYTVKNRLSECLARLGSVKRVMSIKIKRGN
jgi:hypothetical protein